MGLLLGGIDEAGRGPVIGPLVIGLFLLDETAAGGLSDLGVNDSKKIAPKRREKLFESLKRLGKFKLHVSSAKTIDERTESLNDFEIRIMAELIQETPACKRVFIDSVQADGAAFTRKLRDMMGPNSKATEILAMPGGDIHFPMCSAASIGAKVTRDRLVRELYEDFGDFGSGYPSDPRTKAWLRERYKEYGSFPKIVRHTWSTAVRFTEPKTAGANSVL